MTSGRKPTPTALKLVKGNPGKRAVNKAEAVVALSEPTPPAFLCDDAKVEWGRVCSALYAAGLMTELDRAALAAYCAAYGRWAQAAKFSFWLHCATPILWGCSDFMREAPCMPRRRNKNDNEKTRTPGL